MHTPDRQTFLTRAAHGNLVPVWRELLADQESPVSAYKRLRSALQAEQASPHTFLLESVEGGEHIARYSFLGGRPRTILAGYGNTVAVEDDKGNVEILRDVEPLNVLKEHMARYQPVPDPELPPFFGGAVGFIGYDAVPQFEPRVPLSDGDRCTWPEMLFIITDTIVVFDRARHTIKVVANAFIEGDAGAAYDDAVARIERICESLSIPAPYTVIDAGGELPPIEHESNVEREVFESSVERAKEYIRAGDVIQVVLSQRFTSDYEGDPLNVYRALRAVNPSPYMFCLELGGRTLIGSSPEIHVRCEDRHVEIRPIAGTRPRSRDPEKDRRLEEELLADPKERAEHVMLVDLARNDIGRVCDYGSVNVSELMVIERYSHVMHIVTDVVGRLGSDHDEYDLMRATFPAGTVSGAPKVRAMEIIAELETDTRGPYAGAVTYFGFTGNLDSCITIRTILLEGGKAHVQAGAGIVADSDPAFEYEETRNKARGMLKALALARRFDDAPSGETSS